MFTRFLPQTVPFFELLVQQNALLQEMSEALAVVMDNTEASERHLKRINLLEEEADRLYRSITLSPRRLSHPSIVRISTRSTWPRNGWRIRYSILPTVFLFPGSCTSVFPLR